MSEEGNNFIFLPSSQSDFSLAVANFELFYGRMNTSKMRPVHLLVLLTALPLSGCLINRQAQNPYSRLRLNFLSEFVIPYQLSFEGTTVGGLSGIDYEAERGVYHSICDDRSERQPARFYTYRIEVKNDKIDTVIFQKTTFLKDADGNNFPQGTPAAAAVDPEALRYWDGRFIWSSEGERSQRDTTFLLRNPEIFLADRDGNYLHNFELPKQVKMNNPGQGVRHNGGFEGLALSPSGKYLFASVEEPLLQDGPRANLGIGGVVRILKFDLSTLKSVAQYAYPIEPVAHSVHPPEGFRVNGISDILCLDEDRLLVIERSYSTGRLSCTIRLYLADLSVADDIAGFPSLEGARYKKAKKKLILNMDHLGRYIDNIEGVTFGPRLASGRPSLLFIADDNFNPEEKSQLLLFEMHMKPQ